MTWRPARPTALLAAALVAGAAVVTDAPHPEVGWFLQAAGRDERVAREALARIAERWRDEYASMVVDLARLLPARRRPIDEGVPAPDTIDVDPSADAPGPSGLPPSFGRLRQPGELVRERLIRFLERQTGQRFGDDLARWRGWMWQRPPNPHPDYAVFKATVYGQIDPAMRAFFPPGVQTTIRLDEIDWGGVAVNGIPPLRQPRAVAANDAPWLKDSHVVFGVAVGGAARAYPKRILAWHELALDTLAGVDVALVYCTLCGTAIPYRSRAGERTFTFGTSGLLYRSNKLMFDEETRSLWSALDGAPVVGPLAGTGLRLEVLPVVTTTWGEWRAAQPDTTVVSLDTGFDRDYSEGAAYREYFATDRLMFEVPFKSDLLKNKAEVLVVRPDVDRVRSPVQAPVAIAAAFLARHPVFETAIGGDRVVVLTSRSGANRVYDADDVRFEALAPDGRVRDAAGRLWRVTEAALVSPDNRQTLLRVPAHRAFWFGWYAQHPDTILIR